MRFIRRKIPLRFRHAVPVSVLCAAATLVVAPLPVRAQAPSSNISAPTVDEVVITSLRGDRAMLSEGSDAGFRVGSVFTVSRDGVVRAKLRVIEVFATQSAALLYDVQDGYQITVGDSARYFTFEAPVVATPTPQPTPDTSLTPAATPTPNVPLSGTGMGTTTPPLGGTSSTGNGDVLMSPSSYVDARITSIDGKNVSLNSGLQAGIRTGVNVPVWRNGSVAAILRITNAATYDSLATITWQDDAAQTLAVGDTIRIESSSPVNVGGNSNGGEETVIDNGKTVAPVPIAPIRYETGASNEVVPRADRAYELLSGLAASGLITSQPADVFQDDGILRHRTENDINFTRAQIAAFVREALDNAGATGATHGATSDKVSGRNRAALGFLVRDYGRELAILRTSPEKIAQFGTNGNGFSLGYSGVARASVVSGNGNFLLPFSEPQGDVRLKSGADVRLNLFGNINKRLSFFSTVDATTSLDNNSDNSNVVLRRAVLSYDASNIARGLTIEAGKNEYWFGPGHYGTLLLSDNAGGLNSFHTQLKRGSFQYDGVYALLGRGPSGGNRALYARNFQFKIGSQARVGFAESLLAPKRTFDAINVASTLAPIPLPLSYLQNVRGQNGIGNGNNTNSQYEVYGETSVASGAQLYGEFLLDDISTTPTNLTRNRLGSLLGIHVFQPDDPTRVGAYFEYTTLGGRTYFAQVYTFDQDFDYNYFQHGDSLGYPNTAQPGAAGRGGADSFRFTVYGKPTNRLSLSGGFEFTDKNSEQSIVGRQQVFRLRAAYNFRRNLTLYGRYLNVHTGVGPSAVGTPPSASAQTRQSRFELGLAQSF